MRFILSALACAALAAGVAGCNSLQPGPTRPITIDDDVTWARDLVQYDLSIFVAANPNTQAALRNEIVTARMYIADMEYHYYETRLTRDMQEEGFAATMASLALTTSATLIPVTQTKTLLSGIATGVTGADKAVTEKILLSNTIQALQTQMRADRKTEAGVIFAKMSKPNGVVTPITEYTLAMALSDADTYYQAGTIGSALIGLSKTVANADQTADQTKALSGPNPGPVSAARMASAPTTPPPVNRQFSVIRNVTTPLTRMAPTQLSATGEPTDPIVIASIRKALCLSPDGGLDDEAHKRLGKYLDSIHQPHSERFAKRELTFLNRLIRTNKTASCSLFG